jgi:hypothetical protein
LAAYVAAHHFASLLFPLFRPMAQPYGQSNIAIFGYGSLLSDPGEKILPHTIASIPS